MLKKIDHKNVKLAARGSVGRAALAALFVLIPGITACQGELMLTNPGSGGGNQTPDMSMEMTNPDTVSYADINRDLDQPILGCTLNTPACHGGATPSGIIPLKDNALVDMAKLMDNYTEVRKRVDPANAAMSILLLKTLDAKVGGTAHSGSKPFASTDDPIYRRWLQWIQLGAKFEPVSTTGVN